MILPVAMAVERCILEFRGGDVVRFLNGQLSNDVRRLTVGEAMHACVMTAKGRMNAEVWLTKLEDGIRLDGPSGLGEELLARFERYIISDDVSVVDVTHDWRLRHVLGEAGGVRSRRFGDEGTDHWYSPEVPAKSKIPELSPLELESLRIERGIPAWGSELDESSLPVEAGLERDSIDYHKGCYIGQEVVSRLKSVGHVNRLLVRLAASKDSPLAAGFPLFAEKAEVGSVTSAAPSLDLEKVVALAYVKRAFSAPGTLLRSRTLDGEVHTVLPLHP